MFLRYFIISAATGDGKQTLTKADLEEEEEQEEESEIVR